jgi:hypothetical protein
MIKVKQLIEMLKKENPDSEVIVQEKGDYSPLESIDGNCVYIKDTTWRGDVYSLSWSADDACMDESDWEKLKRKPHCVVLHPVN